MILIYSLKNQKELFLKYNTPKTGDDRDIELYLFLAGLSSLGLIATGKKKEDEVKKKLK